MAATPCFPLRVFYDGACPLCSREIEHYHRLDRQGTCGKSQHLPVPAILKSLAMVLELPEERCR